MVSFHLSSPAGFNSPSKLRSRTSPLESRVKAQAGLPLGVCSIWCLLYGCMYCISSAYLSVSLFHRLPSSFILCLCFHQETLVEVNRTTRPCALAAQLRNCDLSSISFSFNPISKYWHTWKILWVRFQTTIIKRASQ